MRRSCRALISAALAGAVLLASAPATAGAPLDDFKGTFQDTVIQITFVKVGPRLRYMYVGDIEDSRHDLQLGERFVAGQVVVVSVFERRGYRVSFWGEGAALTVKASEALDLPAGKGLRLTYEDGTIVEVVA